MDVALVTSADLPELEPYDRPLLEALRQRGVDAHPVVWSDAEVDWASTRVAVIRSAWDSHLRPDEFLRWADAAGQRTRLFNPPDVLRWNLHKRYLRELAERGVTITDTEWVARKGTTDLRELMERRGWDAVVMKPAVSAGARETHVYAQADVRQAQAHLDRLVADHELMLQPYLRSFETEGERSYVFVDGTLSHAIHRPPTLLTATRGFDKPRAFEPENRVELELANKVIEAIDRPLLYARVDLATDNEGNPRLQEVELAEPCLFLSLSEGAPGRLATAIEKKL